MVRKIGEQMARSLYRGFVGGAKANSVLDGRAIPQRRRRRESITNRRWTGGSCVIPDPRRLWASPFARCGVCVSGVEGAPVVVAGAVELRKIRIIRGQVGHPRCDDRREMKEWLYDFVLSASVPIAKMGWVVG